MLVQFPRLHLFVRSIKRSASGGTCLHLVHHVHDPRADGLDQHLRAFALQKLEHVEVAVAFGDLRPELANDLHDGLYPEAVNLDGSDLVMHSLQGVFVGVPVELLADFQQRVDPDFPLLAFVRRDALRHPPGKIFVVFEGFTVAQHGAERVDRFVEDPVRFALLNFIRADAIDHLVHDVAEIEGVEHAHAKVDGELQSGLAGGSFYAVVLLKEQHAETIEARILQGQAILGFVHTEATRPTRTGGEEDVVVDDLLLGETAGSRGSADASPDCPP